MFSIHVTQWFRYKYKKKSARNFGPLRPHLITYANDKLVCYCTLCHKIEDKLLVLRKFLNIKSIEPQNTQMNKRITKIRSIIYPLPIQFQQTLRTIKKRMGNWTQVRMMLPRGNQRETIRKIIRKTNGIIKIGITRLVLISHTLTSYNSFVSK